MNAFKSSIQYLLSIESKGIKMGLNRTLELSNACDNPDKKLDIIQVAGTNGKGSTCAMIANILIEAGYKVGLFTSPHLVNLNERIRINGLPIANEDIDKFISFYKNDIEQISASFFETITIMAFWYFQKNNVDYAIMETGLGGKLDSVTICNPKLAVITSISMDHSEILGDSLVKIAKEKAGIIKKDISCITVKHSKEIDKIIQSECIQKNAKLIVSDDFIPLSYNPSLKGNAQFQNAHLAEVTINTLLKDINDEIIIRAIEGTKWYGRNQIIQKEPTVIFDVAHNDAGVSSFMDFIKSISGNNKKLILSLQLRKNIKNQVSLLLSVFDEIILCETHNKRTMRVRDLKSNFRMDQKLTCIQSEYEAIQYALDNSSKDDLIAIIGTHHFGDAISKIFNMSFNLL